MAGPNREQVQNMQWNQALNNRGGDNNKDSSQLLIEGIEQAKKDIQNSLLGYHYEHMKDDKGEWKVVRVEQYPSGKEGESRKICNEKCVGDIMATIDSTVNINTLGSNLSDKNISDLGEDALYAIIEKITLDHDEYDIKSTSDANQIRSIISTNVMAALRKARHARFLQHDEQTLQKTVVETLSDEKESRFL